MALPQQQWQQQQQPLDPQLQGFFMAVDKDRSGQIDAEELRQALSQAGQPFSIEASRIMLRMFDQNGSGTITMQEFGSLHHYIMQMQAAFQHVDKDKTGSLTFAEVQQAIATSGYVLSQQTLSNVMQKCDRQRRGCLTLDGYIELCCFLGTARNLFAPMDPNRTGTATFSFDQFINVASMLTI
uniref:EF-hand domain-containing protein n=1 Tax=Eutreptiella gymnastica TaxID=73025 RepID=A0A7S4FGP7_9EUGL